MSTYVVVLDYKWLTDFQYVVAGMYKSDYDYVHCNQHSYRKHLTNMGSRISD